MDIEVASKAIVAYFYNPVLARKSHEGSIGIYPLLAYSEQAVNVMPELCLDGDRGTAYYYEYEKEFSYTFHRGGLACRCSVLLPKKRNNLVVIKFSEILDDVMTQLSYYVGSIGGGDADGGNFLQMIPNAPIGLWQGLEYEGEFIESIKGKPLFIYTDGLNEAENPQLERFGDEHMLEVLRETRFANAMQVVEKLKRQVEEHRDGADPNDDLTMMCLKVG